MADTRSYARITRSDLKRLVRLAQDERDDLFTRHPEWAILYRKRILCVGLCGDGALIVLLDPTMTVRLNGVVPVTPAAASWSPDGSDRMSSTLGTSWILELGRGAGSFTWLCINTIGVLPSNGGLPVSI